MRSGGCGSRGREGLCRGGLVAAARDRLGRRAVRDRQRLGALAPQRRRECALPGRRPCVCRKAEGAVDRIVGLGVRMALAAEPRLARVPQFCASIDEAVHRDCERVRPKLRTRFASLFTPRPPGPGELCLERLRIPLRLLAGRARILSRRVRSAAPDRGALRAVADRQERLVDASSQRMCAGWRSGRG